MKFKGEPNLFVRIIKPKHGEVKSITFDKEGFYETTHPITIKRLKTKFEEIEEIEEIELESTNNNIKNIDYSSLKYKELQALYAEKTGNSAIGVSKVDIIKELEVK